jgi:hypothetical protein
MRSTPPLAVNAPLPPKAADQNRRVRSTPPPAVNAPLHLRRKQKTSPLREEHATARGKCASSSPPKAADQSLMRGPGPTSHPPWAPVPGCREVKPLLAPVPRLLRASAEDRKIFKTDAATPRAWPNKSIKCGGHESVSRGDRRDSWRDRGRTGSNYASEHTEAAHPSTIQLWPHLQARILP